MEGRIETVLKIHYFHILTSLLQRQFQAEFKNAIKKVHTRVQYHTSKGVNFPIGLSAKSLYKFLNLQGKLA
jgi:hypothetical protein